MNKGNKMPNWPSLTQLADSRLPRLRLTPFGRGWQARDDEDDDYEDSSLVLAVLVFTPDTLIILLPRSIDRLYATAATGIAISD